MHSNKHNRSPKQTTASLGTGNHRQESWRGRTAAAGACPPKRKPYSPDAKAAVARAMIAIRELMSGECRNAVGVKDE